MNIYHSVNREHAVSMDVRDDDKKFIADFYKYAFVGLILDWIKNGMNCFLMIETSSKSRYSFPITRNEAALVTAISLTTSDKGAWDRV